MKKNKFYSILLTVLAIFSICLTPTFGKFTYTKIGVAGMLTFTKLVPTGDFIVDNKDFIGENGEQLTEVKSESKFGTKGENVSDPEGQYGLGDLTNVVFSVSNISNRRLLVTFYIEVYSNGTWAAELVKNSITINRLDIEDNIVDTINGNFTYSGKENSIYKKTVSPIDSNIFSPVNMEVIERSFILEPETGYGKYQIAIERIYDSIGGIIGGIGGLFTTEYFYNFHMVLVEYE